MNLVLYEPKLLTVKARIAEEEMETWKGVVIIFVLFFVSLGIYYKYFSPVASAAQKTTTSAKQTVIKDKAVKKSVNALAPVESKTQPSNSVGGVSSESISEEPTSLPTPQPTTSPSPTYQPSPTPTAAPIPTTEKPSPSPTPTPSKFESILEEIGN